MRVTVGALVVVVVMMFASAGNALPRNDGNPDRTAGSVGHRAAATPEMMALTSESGDGSQQLILIDPRLKSMAVYQVTRATGQITLKSVRNIHSDLQMDEFNNGGPPSPQEIRSLLDHR